MAGSQASRAAGGGHLRNPRASLVCAQFTYGIMAGHVSHTMEISTVIQKETVGRCSSHRLDCTCSCPPRVEESDSQSLRAVARLTLLLARGMSMTISHPRLHSWVRAAQSCVPNAPKPPMVAIL